MINFVSNKTVAVGEAMVEMAEIGEGIYQKGFAGDTFNTAWHMARMPDANLPVRFVTKVGADKVSSEFINSLQADGIDTSHIGRVAESAMGLYVIELEDAERSFHYWRESSAARLLAEDKEWLNQSFQGAGLIHVSGITLAILQPDAQFRLISALASARKRGAYVSFDPNVRPRLWSSQEEARNAMRAMLPITDIALPSFDDETALWGDGSPHETVKRLRAMRVSEIVIKNGAKAVTAWDGAQLIEVPCKFVSGIRDTSGAGDAFNAGYLAARLAGCVPEIAIASGQTMSTTVLQHFGARIPEDQVPNLALSTSFREDK